LTRNTEQIQSFLRSFPPTVDEEAIIASFSTIPLKQKHIQKHVSNFRKLIANGEIQVEEVVQTRFASPESIDGYSMASSRTKLPNINKVHRFVAKLKRSTREIGVQDLSSQMAPLFGKNKLVAVLSNVLSPEECAGLIKRAKGEQFEDVVMNRPIAGGDADQVANCRRSMIEDLDLASELFDRMVNAIQGTELEDRIQHAPWVSEGETGNILNATGLNDRLHILRYGAGQFFAPHRDSRFKRGSEVSHITVQVFLNDNFSGGTTSIRGGKRFVDIKPQAGSVLLFDQDLRREECEVHFGRKFVVRSDVLYEKTAL
jgi:hypothetical protein